MTATTVVRSQIKQGIVIGVIPFREKPPVILALVVNLCPKGNGEGRLVRYRKAFTRDIRAFEQGLPAVGEGKTRAFVAWNKVGGRQAVHQIHVIAVFQIGCFCALNDIQRPISHQIGSRLCP